ncbi:MAG: amidohydrolase family protein [Prevotellaceae bacterium]|jgi:cytosine/adenosine deaminase-related metal-dependent hydrolase|nr:amidohydrolase family protein [Prevotellaceae bacterium]
MRKIAAHYIFPISQPPIKNAVLAVSDAGKILEISSEGYALTERAGVEFYNGVLVPGFVNAHCHLELSGMKGRIPKGVGLTGFLESIIGLKEEVNNELSVNAAEFVDAQMYASGISVVADISNTTLTIPVKKKSKIHYHTFLEKSCLFPKFNEEVLRSARALEKEFIVNSLPASITPHAPYSLPESLYRELLFLGSTKGLVSIHNQESMDENNLFINGSGEMAGFFREMGFKHPRPIGNSSIHYMLKNMVDDLSLLLVHNTFTSEADFDFANQYNGNITWVLCPLSNRYIENTLPPVELLKRRGANIAIGTDGLSSNDSLQVVDELKLLQEQLGDSTTLNELILWATLNGAKALNLESKFGSFEKEKAPGVVLLENVDFQRLRLTKDTTSRRLI